MSTTTITPTPFERHEQRMRGLVGANVVRMAHARAKNHVKALGRGGDGAEHAAELIVDTPRELTSMDVGELLLVIPGLGKTRAKRLLARVNISPWRELQELTDRQRGVLAYELRQLADHQRELRAA